MVVDGADKVLLARVDERTKNTASDVAEIKAAIQSLDQRFVSKTEFAPVRAIVFGAVALVLLAVLGALVATTIGSPK